MALDLLTPRERLLHAMLGQCMLEFIQVVGDGPTKDIDLAEIRTKIHDLQHRLAGNHLARSSPEFYNLLGYQGAEPAAGPPSDVDVPTAPAAADEPMYSSPPSRSGESQL